jgi:hypothetical protein
LRLLPNFFKPEGDVGSVVDVNWSQEDAVWFTFYTGAQYLSPACCSGVVTALATGCSTSFGFARLFPMLALQQASYDPI